MNDQFLKAHQDALLAVKTFLPSLSEPLAQQTSPPPPHPLAKRHVMQEMVHAAALASHVEKTSSDIALGRPVQPATPPTPQEQFPPELDVIHTNAIAAAIAAHPETDRGRLISEAHENLVKFIAGHNGKVIVHGKVLIAHSPKEAQNLAARIVNDEVEGHDQEKAAGGDQSGVLPASTDTGDSPRERRSVATVSRKDVREPVGSRSARVADSDRSGTQEPAPAIGATDPETGRTITHSTDDLDQAQDIATQAAPELESKLQDIADQTPGVEVHGVRPVKDKDRAQRKEEADDKPVNTHSDLLAGRLVVDSPEAKNAAVAAIKSSTPVIDEEDSFQDGDPEYGFRSHDLQVVLGDGDKKTSAEVQIVPKEVADVDEETHPTYEKGRDAEADGDTETADQAKQENRDAHDAAMAEFNKRNDVQDVQDPDAKLRDILKQAGIEMTGGVVRIGGHAFVPIKDDVESDANE